MMENGPLIENDAVLFGILMVIIGLVFYTKQHPNRYSRFFYNIVPPLALCYFLPSLLNTFGWIDYTESNLHFVATRYLLPASLILLTLYIDLKLIARLGPNALIMFATGTLGIIIGGPLAIFLVALVNPESVGDASGQEVWRGLSAIAGSWIGGGANFNAMKEVFDVSGALFSSMVAVDVVITSLWLIVMFILVGRAGAVDRAMGADTSSIEEVRQTLIRYEKSVERAASIPDMVYIVAISFGGVALAHMIAGASSRYFQNMEVTANSPLASSFFWIVASASAIGLLLSFTRARNLEGAGASRLGTLFIYILVAITGLAMDIRMIAGNLALFAVGAIWISFHGLLLLGVARIIRAPVFYVAVGSMANVGGAASAPVIAAAYHPALAPVGVLLALLGYGIGIYGATLCAYLMYWVAP